MQTNDNEYFRSAVTDEWNTPRPLTEQEQADAQKQQAFRTKRHRTAQRAFSLAAPVAVVAVAATLVTTAAYTLTPCPVCGKTQCNYYANGHRAQGLLETDLTRVETKRLTEENQFAYENLSFSGERGNLALSSYLTMENGSSVGISYEEVNQFLYDQGKPVRVSASDNSTTGTQLQYVGFHLINNDEEDIYYHVLYLADGSTPAEHSIWDYGNVDESLKDLPYTYAEQKLGDDPLWVIVYSFSDQITAQEILPEIEPVILPVPTGPVQVGFDLILTWDDSVRLGETRGVNDVFYGYSFDKADNERESYALRQTPSSSYYLMKTDRGKSFRVRFAPYDWDQVQAAWTKLYEKAPATGHMGLSASEPLQPVEVNGVTYHAYILLNRSTEGGEMESDNLLFVPQNDPTSMIECPIHDVTTNDPASLAGSTVEEIVGENTDWQSVLSLFYPAGSEPDPLPAPTPTPKPTPEPAPTATPAGEEPDSGIARSTEFTYSLPDMHLAEVGSYAWISSRSWSDYTIEELGDANRVSSLVSPGSGRTVVAVRKAFDTRTDLSSGNAVVTTAEEPYSHTELYAWMDSDGTLNWYRNTNGLGVDAYAVIRPEGVCCRYEWTAEGPLSYTVYPDRDTAFALYDRNPLLAHSKLDSGSHDYDPADTVHDYAKYTVGASYATPMQLLDDSAFAAFGDTAQYDLTSGGRVYTLYVDSNMHLLSALDTYALGVGVVTPDYTVFGVVEDTPDLTSVLEAFARLETVDCTLNVNGEAAALPLYTGIDNHIAVNSDGASITANTPVTQENGRSASIPDDAAFTLDGPVDITVRY